MNLMFWIIAIFTLGSALMMVMKKNLFHSALYMILTFLGVAAMYILLYAEFLAAVQVMVYAGGISIFIAFGIMLTQRGNMQETNLFSKHAPLAALVALAVIVMNGIVAVSTNWRISNVAPPEESVGPIAELMLTNFVVPFEAIAILLLVALMGAVLIVKEVKKTS